MTRPDADERLSRALRDLPPSAASAGFTRRVLRDLERAPHEYRSRLRFRVAWAALAAALILAAGIQLTRDAPSESERLGARAQSLRAESEHLRNELRRLERLAEETAPVLYLDETEQFDLVLDLRPYMQQARPAGYAPARSSDDRR